MAGKGLPVVCILHGDPPLPDWLARPDPTLRLHLTVNDPGPGRYPVLPAAASVHVNAGPVGFGANANAALDRLDDGEVVVIVNFDVVTDAGALRTLADVVLADPALAAAGALLIDPQGRPTHGVGRLPTPLRELTRAAGLRSGRGRRISRALLRRAGPWRRRNSLPPGGRRLLGPDEYLPWTAVALRRAAFAAIGPFDDRFPLYAEDIDWARRAHAAGWRLAVADVGPIAHTESVTTSAYTLALTELGHAELHGLWGPPGLARWQRLGLALRRRTPLRWLTPGLDWSVLDAANAGRGR